MNQIREMVVANQNETVRKKASQENVFLATIGLMGCVAVIFYNHQDGSVSLTHVDTDTDLSFLRQELAWVGEPCQVFIIKNQGDLNIPVHLFLKSLHLSNITIKDSIEGTVVFNHQKGVPQIFKMSDFINLNSPGVVPEANNPLYRLKYHATFSEVKPELVQKRTYERQLNAAASQCASHYPLLVHQEKGWLCTSYELAHDVKDNILSEKFNDCPSVHYVWPRYQRLLNYLSHSADLKAKDCKSTVAKV